jgi:hypothetical protein
LIDWCLTSSEQFFVFIISIDTRIHAIQVFHILFKLSKIFFIKSGKSKIINSLSIPTHHLSLVSKTQEMLFYNYHTNLPWLKITNVSPYTEFNGLKYNKMILWPAQVKETGYLNFFIWFQIVNLSSYLKWPSTSSPPIYTCNKTWQCKQVNLTLTSLG